MCKCFAVVAKNGKEGKRDNKKPRKANWRRERGQWGGAERQHEAH